MKKYWSKKQNKKIRRNIRLTYRGMMRIAKKLTNKIFAKKYRKNNTSQLGVVVAFGKSRLNKLLSALLSRTHLSLLAAGLGLSITQVHAETLVVTPTVWTANKSLSVQAISIPFGSNTEIGISNANNTNELSAAITLGEGDIRMRLAGDISKEQQHALAAIGINYQNGYAIVGGSYARELMAEYDQKLTANSKFIEAGVANPVAGILRAFVKLNQKDAQDKHLDTRVATTQTVTVQDILTVFDTPTATTYRNTRKVTTTDTTTTTNTDFVWGKSQTVTLGADFAVTPATKLALMAYHARTKIPGADTQTQTTGAVAVTEYFPSQNMNATLGYASSGRIALGAEKAISDGWTAKMTGFADTKGANRQHGVYVGANYTFGWTATNPGKMPLTTGDQFVEALRQLNTNSPETARNVLGLGRVAVSKVVMQTKRVEETVGVNTVNKPPVASDTTPDAFTFVDQTGVALSSVITSAPIAISGITAPSLISVTGGEYSIAGGAWTSAPGTITNGQTVAVRGTSSATNSTAKAVTLTVGGVSDTFDITTVAATPNTPLVLGSINCTATVIQHGQTTTCQITPVDPDGIQSLRAEIDGVPVSVSVSGDTYSIPVSGLPAGTTDGILTSQNHTIRVYASGKKPDTSAESEQSTTATITVQCNWTWTIIPWIPSGWICSL